MTSLVSVWGSLAACTDCAAEPVTGAFAGWARCHAAPTFAMACVTAFRAKLVVWQAPTGWR